MKVTVMKRTWNERQTIDIEIAEECPICGLKRGIPYGYNFYEDGQWYWVHRWTNPCGHIDMYDDCIKESKQRECV